MPSLYDRARHKLLAPILARLVPRVRRNDMTHLGTSYGGREVPGSLLGAASVCYCVGVGEDISFDKALIDAYGCDVHAFDPTPRSIAFVERQLADDPALAEKFHFEPVALWESDGTQRFYSPANADHVSHSLTNLFGSDDYIEVPTKTLRTLMAERGHDRVDLLKIDIEGAEYAVVGQLLEGDVLPKILCVEFDQPTPARKTLALVKRLREEAGYDFVSWNMYEWTFVRR